MKMIVVVYYSIIDMLIITALLRGNASANLYVVLSNVYNTVVALGWLLKVCRLDWKLLSEQQFFGGMAILLLSSSPSDSMILSLTL